jgi:predicted esterase
VPRTVRRALLSGVLLAVLCAPATAGAADYAPVDRPGPALTVPQADLNASLECSPGVDHASRAPVLLLHGTGSNPKDNWSWTYEPAFDKIGVPWCALTSPDHANGDIQVNGEYVVNAIRTMYARAGRKIAVVGHSQGGMVPRWALRFWPDTRGMIDDVIGFAATNHGTTQAKLTCNPTCSASTWQQRDDSNFIKALNSFQESFPGISYTEIYTHTDEIVTPNNDSNGSSSIHGGGGQITNVATQDICPLDLNEHLAIGTVDPVAYALAIDALDHTGPADPSRISPLTCLQALQPGVDPVTFPINAAQALINLETSPETKIPAEPELRCYTLASCGTATQAVQKKKAKCKKRKRHGHTLKRTGKRKKACHRKKHRRH